MRKYDVAVIGSGPAGQTAARKLADHGGKVAVIEEDLWGGTCPNRGCDPKKMLVSGLEAADLCNQLAGKGLTPVRSLNWPELLAFKRAFTDPVPRVFEKRLRGHGVDTIKGSARFLDAFRVEAGGQAIEADAFIIATGRRPAILEIAGKEYLKTSTDFLDMESMPRSMTLIGAGYIAFELACIANAAGCAVTVAHHNDRPLKGFDEALVSDMVRVMEAKGIRFAFNAEIERISKRGGSFLLEGKGFSEETDYAVCAVGRLPNLETLRLERAGVEYGRRGVAVNGFMQTSNPAIYACGDVVAKKQPMLTPVARLEGNYIARRLLGKESGSVSYPPVPTVLFGGPKLAAVGVSTARAREEPQTYSVREVDMTRWFNNRRTNEPVSKAKLVYERGRLAGAHILSAHADELIGYLTMIIDGRISEERVGEMVFGFPTIAGDLQSLLKRTGGT